MIDICPVGALTSKPFRYSARTWELSRRKSVSPHDSTGANLVVQVKDDKVMRVVPLENEDVNECWIADRDRFSYEALNSDARLTQPMIKQGGAVAGGGLEHRARLRGRRPEAREGRARRRRHRRAGAAPHGTVEELHLLAKLVRGLGSENIDHRLRHADFGNAAAAGKARWLGTSDRRAVDSWTAPRGRLASCARTIRCSRSACARRRASGAQVHSLHAVHDDWLMPLAHALTAAPARLGAGPGRRGRGRGRGQGRGGAAAGRRHGAEARRPSPRRCSAASARPCCWATPPRSTRRPARCWRWRSWIAAQTGATRRLPGRGRPTASARSWSARCRAPAA